METYSFWDVGGPFHFLLKKCNGLIENKNLQEL